MNFEAALKAMREGRKVRRPGWVRLRYLLYCDGTLWRMSTDSLEERVCTVLNSTALLAEDWEIVPE